jgi:hemolysin III
MGLQHPVFSFPDYSAAERAADRVVHVIGVPLCIVAALVLLYRIVPLGSAPVIASVAIYAFGLAGMVTSSAAYQLSRPGLAKERLRRVDRAMIFVMIAGTYTPFSVNVLAGNGGGWLCVILWSLAAIGIFLSLFYPRRFERALMAVYLIMGWMLLALIRDCFAVLSLPIVALLIAGGVVYTIGAVVQAQTRLKYHNPIWHALILCAASLHYAAISLKLTGGVI